MPSDKRLGSIAETIDKLGQLPADLLEDSDFALGHGGVVAELFQCAGQTPRGRIAKAQTGPFLAQQRDLRGSSSSTPLPFVAA
jgi:hypothetical protein